MRCPKCSYISFDYNQVCPKCNREISGEQAKLNLPAFRPDPPSMLAALTGEHNESNVDLRIDSASVMGARGEADADLEDSVIMESGEMSLDEEEDFDISLESEEPGEFEELGEEVIEAVSDFETEGDEEEIAPVESAMEEEELTIDFDEVSLDDSEDEEQAEVELDIDDVKVDETGDQPLDEPDVEVAAPDKSLGSDDEEISIDLEDLDLDLDLEKSDD